MLRESRGRSAAILEGLLTVGIEEATSLVESFRQPQLRSKVAQIEGALAGANSARARDLLGQFSVTHDLLLAAASVKRASAQIDVVIHVIGILVCLPRLLADAEKVEAVSLGAGNSGGDFDLETDRRVAEFKFIAWQGGGDAVRKKTLFEDCVKLALYSGTKDRYIYLLDLPIAQAFLKGTSSTSRILDRNARLFRSFTDRFGSQYPTVGAFWARFSESISLVDLTTIAPELAILRTQIPE